MLAVIVLPSAPCMTVGLCYCVTKFVSDLQGKLQHFNDDLNERKLSKLTIAEKIEMRKKFYGIIEYHSEAIELSVDCSLKLKKSSFSIFYVFLRLTKHFSDTNSGAIAIFFLYTITSFGSLFLQTSLVI